MTSNAWIGITVLGMLVYLAVVTTWALHKLRRMHKRLSQLATSRQVLAVYGKYEALDWLYRHLGLPYPLPPLRGFSASSDFLRTIAEEILRGKPRLILELGSGSSTAVIARALQIVGHGRLISFDHDEGFARQTQDLLLQHGLADQVNLVYAPLREIQVAGEKFLWYATEGLPRDSIDLVIVDGPPEATQPLARYPAYPVLRTLLSENATLLLDDADRPDERQMVSRWLAEDPTLRAQFIPLEKGCMIVQRRVSQAKP